MILPTLKVKLLRQSGHDLRGQPVLAYAGSIMVAPVRLVFRDQHTTVRTDSSSSHGAADETVADIVLLALPRANLKLGDVLEINGRRVRVAATHARYTVGGRLSHFQIECEA